MQLKVQWKGDNRAEIEQALVNHYVRVLPGEDKSIHLSGLGGLDIQVQLGETIEVRLRGDGLFDGIGVHRLPDPGVDPEIVWRGDNAGAIAEFVKQHGCDMRVVGDDLTLHWDAEYVRLHRGDKLFRRGGRYLGVSRAGRDHRV